MTVRVAGHFGEWVQGRLGPAGPLALVSVTWPDLGVTAARRTTGALELQTQDPALEVPNASTFLQRVGAVPGRFELSGNIPPGGGAGAATAALVALARAAGGSEVALPQACIAAEGASDPLMLPRPDGVLWASRDGRALGAVPALPRAEIVGGFWGPPLATDGADMAFPEISDLARRLQTPLSLTELADVASASARRCTDMRGPTEDPTADLARRLEALGHLRAHTGSARGLIFAPGTAPPGIESALQHAGYRHVLRFQTGGCA